MKRLQANERTSKPNMCRKLSPTYKNKIISAPEIAVALASLMGPDFSRMEIRIGTDPTISITAKSVNTTVSSSLKLMDILKASLCKDIVTAPAIDRY